MNQVTYFDQMLIRKWMSSNANPADVEKELAAKGVDTDNIAAYLKEYKRSVTLKRQVRGFVFLGAGAFLGFLSCVITLLNSVPGMYGYTLYGLTMVALVLMCTGLYFIFE